ncbi:MAG: hypothetical protein NTZ09_00335 [Candidatus Hydrogenedentes bacterium]|nr:hypothetical protein [Candidatus Hydrogenedentota bacterium]
MARRIGLALGIILVAGIVLFVLMRGDLLRNDEAGRVSPREPQGASPMPSPEQRVPTQKGEAIMGDGAGVVPVEALDRALETATANIEVPKGIRSHQIPEDNGLHWFLLAAELMPQVPWDVVNDILEKGWRDDADILNLLERCQPAFETIRKGIATGNVGFPPCGLEEPVPYLSKWRTLARLMTAESLMYGSRGNYDAALDELADVFDFAAESSRDGFLMTYLVGNAIQDTGTRPLCDMLQSPALSAEQCRAIINRLQATEARASRIADAVMAEADLFDYSLQQFPSPEELHALLVLYTQYDGAGTKFAKSVTPQQCAEWYSQMPKAIRGAAPLLETPVYQFKKGELRQFVSANPISERMLDVYYRAPEAEARGKTLRSGPLLVAAIEAYRHENGAYPQSLDALAPSVLEELPNDPFTGSPFRYQRQGTRYRLYSAGVNMRDDGGRGKPWDATQDDYVIVGGQ